MTTATQPRVTIQASGGLGVEYQAIMDMDEDQLKHWCEGA